MNSNARFISSPSPILGKSEELQHAPFLQANRHVIASQMLHALLCLSPSNVCADIFPEVRNFRSFMITSTPGPHVVKLCRMRQTC
jgi:hypothetical protein